jgi:branched-chain amino acid transport system substrate-binding protein
VTPKNGTFVQIRGCQEIPALSNNHFADIRAYEKTLGIG